MIKHLNGWLVAAFYLALFIPLVYWVGFAGIPTWGIPFVGLLATAFMSLVIRNRRTIRRPDIYENAVFLFILSIWISSILHPPPTMLGINKLFVFCLALLFSIYVKRHWNDTFNLKGMVALATGMIAIQFIIGILQFLTQSTIGNPSARLGISQETALGGGAGLGIGRVIGSVGSSPNILGQIIVTLIPFIAIIDRVVSTKGKWRSLVYVGKPILFGLAIILVTLTASRSSIGILAIMMVLTGCSFAWKWIRSARADWSFSWRRLWGGYVLLILSGIILIWFGRNPRYIRTLQMGADLAQRRIEQIGESNYGPLDLRLQLSAGAVQMFFDSPLVLGHGYLNTKNISRVTDVHIRRTRDLRVHNAYLQFLAEGGVFAFLAILTFTLYPLLLQLSVKHKTAENYCFIASLLVILAFMQTSTTYDAPATAPVYALVWGGGVAFARSQMRRARQRSFDSSQDLMHSRI